MIHINENCQAFQLLSMLAVVGEYPLRQLHLLGNPRMYRDTLRRMCQQQEYINDSTKEKVSTKALTITGKGFQRSVRLLQGAEPLLKWLGASEYYGEAYGQYNFSGGEKHRNRNFKIAETTAFCKSAGYEYRPYRMQMLYLPQKEFSWSDEPNPTKRIPSYPCIYPIRILKGGKDEGQKKNVFTRLTGALFVEEQVYAMYNLGDEMQKLWENSEIKMKYLLSSVNLVNGCGYCAYSCIFLTNDGMSAIKSLRYLYNKRKNRKKDRTGTEFYYSVHWVPLTDEGKKFLRFFSAPNWKDKIEKIFFSNQPREPFMPSTYWVNDERVYSFLTGDIAELISFKKAIMKIKVPFRVYCFSYQIPFLKSFLGNEVVFGITTLERVEKLLKADENFYG